MAKYIHLIYRISLSPVEAMNRKRYMVASKKAACGEPVAKPATMAGFFKFDISISA
jgi:hypothetical protein